MRKTTILRTTLVIIGILRKRNKFLLTYRDEKSTIHSWANKHWQFPGGGIEFGETPENTVMREMKEELGIDVKNPRLITKIFSKTRKDWYGLLICYICGFEQKQKIVLNEEASKYGWFTIEEINKLKTLPGTIDILMHI